MSQNVPVIIVDHPAQPAQAHRTWATAATVGLVLFAFVVYLVLSLARWHRWENPSWDLAIFQQAVRGYAELGAPVVTIKGADFNQLGDHFSPLLVVIAPFYRAFPTPVTLLVAQCVLVAISIVPLTTVARRILGTWQGLAVGTAYAFSWGIQAAVDVQFHEYALAVPLLAFGLAAFLDGRWRASAVWIVLLLGVKEDLGLTVAAFGLVLWLRGQRHLGAIVAGVGVLGMALIVGVIVPALNPYGRYDYWGRLEEEGAGGSPGLLSSVARLAGELFVPAVKLETLGLLVLVTALVALRSPLSLLVLPTILWRFAGSVEFYWGTTWHYSVILMPILFAAAIDGLRALAESRSPLLRRYAAAAPAVMLLVAVVLVPRFPLADLWDTATYERSERVAVAQRAVASVPEGSSVASDLGLILQLTTHREVYWIGGVPEVLPDYVALDLTGWGGSPPEDVAAYAESTYPGASYEVVFDEWGYVVLERVA